METKTFYVIWRGDEDDFFITALDLDVLMMAPGSNRLSNNQIIQMAWDAEYLESFDDCGPNPFIGDNPANYDLIDIFSGDNIRFHAI